MFNRSIPDTFKETLLSKGAITESQVTEAISTHSSYLAEELNKIGDGKPNAVTNRSHLLDKWSGFKQGGNNVTTWETGLPIPLLKYIGAQSIKLPEQIHDRPFVSVLFMSPKFTVYQVVS